MRLAAALLPLLLAAPAAAGDLPFRVAVIEDEPTVMTAMLAQPLERVLRETPDAWLVGAENVSCEFGGEDFRFRLPGNMGAPATEDASAAVALESDAEVAIVYPPLPGLVAALVKAAADPRSFRRPVSLRLDEREAEAARAFLPTGDIALNVRARLDRRPTMRRRMSVAVYYRVNWEGKDAAVLVVGRTFGGLGRLGTAAAREEAKGPFLGVSRGGAFGSGSSDAQGRAVLDALARAGLRLSAVDASMAERWSELEAYRKEGGSVTFLSANIAKGGAPVFPPYEIVESSGLRVAFVGLTSPAAEAALREQAGKDYAVKDPVAAVESRLADLRENADVVVALGELPGGDLARLSSAVRGLDLLIGDEDSFLTVGPSPYSVLEQDDRPAFANAFPPIRLHSPALDVLSITRTPDNGRFDWRIVHDAQTLDDGLNPLDGYPEPALDGFAARSSSGSALLPPAREVFPPSIRPRGIPAYEPRDIWTLAGAALAERAGAEASVLGVMPLGVQTVGAVREPYLREWLGRGGPVGVISMPGATLRRLADEAADQAKRENSGQTVSGPLRFVVSGVDGKGRVRGAPLDANARYRVAVSQRAADLLNLGGPGEPIPGYPSAVEAAVQELGERSETAQPEDYRSWMTGAPLSAPGLWRVNFRDVGLNLRQTRVVRSDAFDPVPNSRVQGFNELLVGGVVKTDVDYLRTEYKWTNTLEAEYAKSRVEPRNAPATTNLASNRIMLLTLGTRRAGGIRPEWLARSWGPSLGFQYDGEFEAAPGLRRKNVYSAFPGVEFFDGTVVKSLSTSGIVKRDLSRDPPNTQTGLRLRTLFSAPVGKLSGAKVQGEVWNNYFFLTKQDRDQDLRMEGDANVKLIVPVYKHLSVSPYLDYYWFQLKTRNEWGYSFMMGVTIGFSRLWKPQYERF
jgi:hypothetical protein